MSVKRAVRTGQFWSIKEVETYQQLVAPTTNSIVNGGTWLDINFTDPNGGADTYLYTYKVERSVDGAPFSEIYSYVLGGMTGTLTDTFFFVIGTTVTLEDGSQVTFAPSAATRVTLRDMPGLNPITSPETASLPFDTTAYTADGHSVLLPSGTRVVLPVGTNLTLVAVPTGHDYAYRVMAQNKYEATAYGASANLSVASVFSAQVLAAPTRLDNVVTLSWADPNVYSAGDEIEIWKQVDASGYGLLARIVKSAGAMPTTYDDAFDFLTLVPATYTYKLRAFRPTLPDYGAFSNVGTIIVSFSLSAVTPTATSVIATNHVQTTWTDPNPVPNESGIRVERQDGSGAFRTVGTVAPGTTLFDDYFDTVPGQTYTYRITPFNSLHYGPPSNTALPAAKATAALLSPTVSGVTQTADVGAVVTWTDLNTLQANYEVERQINGGGYSLAGTIPGSQESFSDSFSASLGDIVEYRVRATNPATNGPYSVAARLVIAKTLEAPSEVSVRVVDAVTLEATWSDANTGHRGTRIYKAIGGGAFSLAATLPRGTASYTDATPLVPLVPGQAYSYRLEDFNNQETGPLSPIGTAIDPFRGPTDLTVVSVINGIATLTWVDSDADFDGTEIEIQFVGGPFTNIGTVQKGTQTFQTSILGGTPGGTVTFRVREVKAASLIFGNYPVPAVVGEYSPVASTAAPLLAPTAVTVTRPSPAYNLVTWSNPNPLATGYSVYRSVTYGGSPTPYSFVGSTQGLTSTSFQDFVPAASGVTYSYKVLATNAATSSPLSSAGSLTARFNAPGITAVQTQRTGIFLTVTQPAGYSFLPGDQIQILKSQNGGPATNLVTVAAAFPYTTTDTALAVGDRVSYMAHVLSATESGTLTAPAIKTVYDIVPITTGPINSIRISGSRLSITPKGVFVAGDGGISKVTEDILGEPVVVTQTAPLVLNAKSIASGDLARIVAFTGNSPGSGAAVLLDADNLNTLFSTSLTVEYVSGGVFGWGMRQVRWNPAVVSAQYNGATGAVNLGWGLADVRSSPGTVPPGDWNIFAPVPSYTRFWNNTAAVTLETVFAFNFQNVLPTPSRYENIADKLFYFTYNPVTDTTTPYLVARDTLWPTPYTPFKGEIMDLVSDNVGRIFALRSDGAIVIVDFSTTPSLPSFGKIGQVPFLSGTAPQFTQGAIETAANNKIIASISYLDADNGYAKRTDIFTFSAGPAISASAPVVLDETHTVDEFVSALAYDGGKRFYAASSDTSKLFRYSVGF